MKRNLYVFSTVLLGFTLWLGHQPRSVSRSNGAQLTSNYTGAPGFASCTQCHSGVVNSGPGNVEITTNIPNNTYSPGQTYQVTVTLNSGGGNQAKYGFMLAPMFGTTYKGTLQALDGNCFVEASGRWVTHTSAGSAGGTSSKSFTFNWTAPAAGAGTVILYAAGNCANGNGSDSGDQIYTTSLALNEQTASAGANEALSLLLHAAPNPTRSDLRLEVPGRQLSEVRLYDPHGHCVLQMGVSTSDIVRLDLSNLKAGTYILIAKDREGNVAAERVVKY